MQKRFLTKHGGVDFDPKEGTLGTKSITQGDINAKLKDVQ